MHYTYVLWRKGDKGLYSGCTGDLRKRFNRHNLGKVASTAHRRPFTLAYEACVDSSDAFVRENI